MPVAHDGSMSVSTPRGPVIWWAMVLGGAAAALLFAWLGRLAGVPLATLLAIGAGGVALAWLIVLVTVPWNLYFAARQVVAVITYFSGATAGYYFAGFYLLSTAIRPAVAYVAHVRDRIKVLTRESTYPRDDVASLKRRVDLATKAVGELREELRRTGSTLAGDIAHARQLLTTDLARVQDEQAADRTASRNRDDDLGRRIDQMVRRIEATLDGISDHQELLTGLRALVRMIKPDPA